jgi:uncharacterized membrane-anchored protein YitT (DUF2179 family)
MSKFKETVGSLKDYFLIIIGCILSALAIDIFLVPYKIAPGGVTGLATVIYYITNSRYQVGTIMLILNIPLFLGGMKFIGRKFAIKTLFSTVLLSMLIDVIEPLTNQFAQHFLGELKDAATSSNLLLYCMIGGAVLGAGLGLVFKAGATTGGTDLGAQIVNHFIPHVSIGKILMVIDGIVVVFAAVAFQSFLLGLYAIVTIFITSKIIDTILEGVNFAKAVFVISNHSEAIAQKVLKELDRGVTGLKGTGMYTGTDKQVLLCVLDRTQIPKIKLLVKSVDPAAFVVVTDVREVLGEGFLSH